MLKDIVRKNKPAIAFSTLVVIIVTTVAIVCLSSLKYRFIVKRWGTVDPGMVYRSGRISPSLMETTLAKNNIKTIINLTGSKYFPKSQPERKAAEKLGIEVYYRNMGGNGIGKLEYYVDAIEIIEKCRREEKPVLIHCSAGTNRTGAVIALYQMLVQNRSPQVAYEEMLDYGFDPVADSELPTFLNQNMAYFAEELAKKDLIETIPEPLPKLPVVEE